MKTVIRYIILTAMLWNCNSIKQKPSIVVSVLADKTDSIIPSPSMAHIKLFFDDEKYINGKRIFRFKTITHTSVNTTYKAELEANSYFGNKLQRKGDVTKFYRGIDTLLVQQNTDDTQYYNSSIITPVIEQLKRIKTSDTNRKILLLYSDIFEASDVFNVYRSKDKHLLFNKTESVIVDFKSQLDIPQLDGVELYIIFYPKSLNDNRLFEQMLLVYSELFKDTGLKLYIGIDNPINF